MLAILGSIASSVRNEGIYHPYYIMSTSTYYYYQTAPLLQNDLIYSTQTSNTIAANITGIYDVDNDGNLDDWSTNSFGQITWNTHISYPNSFLTSYFYDGVMTNNVTKIYTGQYSSAPTINNAYGYYNQGNAYDLDNDGNLDEWYTNSEGIITFTKYIVHQYTLTLSPGGSNPTTFYINQSPLTQGTTIYSDAGTGGYAVSFISGEDDIDNDGNIDTWSTDSTGNLYWSMKIIHTYSLMLSMDTYYHDNYPLQSGDTLYNGQGTGSGIYYSTFTGTSDVNNDGFTENWTYDNGIITWSNE